MAVEANPDYQCQLTQSKSSHSPVTDPLELWDEIRVFLLLGEKMGDLDPKLASMLAVERWGYDLKLCSVFTDLFSVACDQLPGPPPIHKCDTMYIQLKD